MFEYVDEGGKCVRCEGVEGVGEFVRASQQYAMAQHHLARYVCVYLITLGLHVRVYVLTLFQFHESPNFFSRFTLYKKKPWGPEPGIKDKIMFPSKTPRHVKSFFATYPGFVTQILCLRKIMVCIPDFL